MKSIAAELKNRGGRDKMHSQQSHSARWPPQQLKKCPDHFHLLAEVIQLRAPECQVKEFIHPFNRQQANERMNLENIIADELLSCGGTASTAEIRLYR
jgi:hypothetical protein